MTDKDKLDILYQSLTPEQQEQEFIELDCSDELYNIFSDKITVEFNGKTGLYIAESFNGKWDLVYQKKQGQLRVKPILIQKFLNS